MSDTLKLEIVTPFGKVYDSEIRDCVIPGELGQFQVLKDHAAVISNVVIGAIKVHHDEKKISYFATSGGFCEVKDNIIKIIVETAEVANEINKERALKAKERAEERLREKNQDLDADRALFALQRAINRLNISNYI